MWSASPARIALTDPVQDRPDLLKIGGVEWNTP